MKENGDDLYSDGSICHKLALTTSSTVSEELKDLKTRRYMLCEKDRSPVLVNTRRVIIK